MFRALLEFHTFPTTRRLHLYGAVFCICFAYGVLNSIVFGRAEARVTYEALALTFALMILGPLLQVYVLALASARTRQARRPPGVIEVTRLVLLENFALEDRLCAYAAAGGPDALVTDPFSSSPRLARHNEECL